MQCPFSAHLGPVGSRNPLSLIRGCGRGGCGRVGYASEMLVFDLQVQVQRNAS